MRTNFKTSILIFLLIGVMANLTKSEAACIFSKQIGAKELKVGNMISWSTVTEENNQFFVVQKSLDGTEFNTIGQVRGAGTSSIENNYRYLDISTGEPKVFYRLMQIDFDGSFTHTPTVIINRENENNFLITSMSSTMTDGLFSLTLRSEIEEKLTYELKDKMSKVVTTGDFEIVKGANIISIDLKEYPNDRYKFVLNVREEEEVIVVRKVNEADMPRINYAVKE